MKITANSIVFTNPNRIAFSKIFLPSPGPGQVITRTLITGVSTGTETRVLAGGQRGAKFPLIPGYENIGEIVAVGDRVSKKVGERVFVGGSLYTGEYHRCWGAQTEYALADETALVTVPPDLDLKSAIYAKTGGIAYHGVQRGRIGPNDEVVIVGLGLIGHLAAQIATSLGAKVVGVDLDESRLSAAKDAGVSHIIHAGKENVWEIVKQMTDGGATVAIDVTGVAATVDQTVRLLRSRSWQNPDMSRTRLVILGSYTDPVAFSYHPSLFDLEPDILPSRDCSLADMGSTMNLLAAKQIRPEFIPTEIMPYTQAPAAYQALQEKSTARVIFEWD